MGNILRDHALTHIWAEPVQDRQYRIKPARVSPALGFYKTADVMWESIRLPNYPNPLDRTSYHVYPLGQIPPHFFRLSLEKKKWYRVDDVVETNNTVIDIVLENGAIVPRNICYLYENYDQNFILIVARTKHDFGKFTRIGPYEETIEVPYTLDEHPLTIRFYTNAIQDSEAWRGDEANDPLHLLQDHYLQINTIADYSAFMTATNAIVASYGGRGMATYYLDGYLIDKPNGYIAEYAGKTLGFHFDETIRQKLYFPIARLSGFRSKLDLNVDKYLLVSPSDYGKIDFNDDLDFYLVRKTTKGYRGVMLDRFRRKNIRQITHNAWSVRQDACIALSTQHEVLSNINLCEIMVVVRNGGMRHGLEYQHNRIEELYHLPYEEIVQSMAEVESNLSIWQAPELERSAYITLMSAIKGSDITQSMVEDAYGYNAATKAVAKALYPVINNKITVDDGYCISREVYKPNGDPAVGRRVIFWYDSSGKLINYTSNNNIYNDIPVPDGIVGAAYGEVILGELVDNVIGDVGNVRDRATVSDTHFGFYGYRNYVCGINNGVLDHNWVDVTGGPYAAYFPAVGSTPPYIQWNYTLLNAAGYYPLTRFASKVVIKKQTFNTTGYNGVFSIDLMMMQNATISTIGVAPGHIDVFMDKVPLIQDLDYYYNKYGSIVITKQAPVDQNVEFIVRYYGYMNPETKTVFKPSDFGFVKNGVLSHNNVFNTMHDRDVRVNVGGRIFTASELDFAEEHNGLGNQLDGKPYSVEPYQALVEPFTNKKTIDYQMVSVAIDKQVSEFLTPRLPEPAPLDEYILGTHWHLYSPIMAYFIRLMEKNTLTDAILNTWDTEASLYNNTIAVVNMFKDVDPIIKGYNQAYVGVYPLAYDNKQVAVTATQYRVLEQINRIHLKSVIDLTHSVIINTGV